MEKYNILLVDDEPSILRSLQRVFHHDSMNVITATSGEEALEVFKKTEIQLLITDNLMPGMTGVELIQMVKRNYPDTIRIVLSGHSDIDSILEAMNSGEAYRFLLKPWNDNELRITVHIALAQYKLEQDNRYLLRELGKKIRILEKLNSRYPEIVDSEMVESSRYSEIEERENNVTVGQDERK